MLKRHRFFFDFFHNLHFVLKKIVSLQPRYLCSIKMNKSIKNKGNKCSKNHLDFSFICVYTHNTIFSLVAAKFLTCGKKISHLFQQNFSLVPANLLTSGNKIFFSVIPAQAGISYTKLRKIPAYAGMTTKKKRNDKKVN